ncbi:MAG: MBL fold metallo-hydrolase [Pseudomonadota bacterium]
MGEFQIAIIPVTPFQQNCALMWDADSKKGVVFDPGGDNDQIKAAIKSQGLTIEAIYLTHGHIDHAAGATDLAADLGVKIIGPHKDDESLLQGLEDQGRMFGVEGAVKNCQPDQWLEGGDTVSIAGRDFEILHCPGHAPGHVVFFCKDLKFAHVGDVLFAGSIGRTDLPGGNHADLIASIKNKLLPLGDDIQFLCGHGPGGTFGNERRTNPFLI